MRKYRLWGLLLLSIAIVSSCTVNVGSSNTDSASVTTVQVEPSVQSQSTTLEAVNPEASWLELVAVENAYSFGEISYLPFGTFGLMAAPTLRLFELHDGTWSDITTEASGAFDIPKTGLDYDIRIQSVLITDDDAIDYVVNYAPAPWHALDAPNQGRDWGTVLSGQDGSWRSVAFADPYGDMTEYTSVESIRFENGALFGSYYGSCGRPCGLLIYSWIGGQRRLEGVEAMEEEAAALPTRWCTTFTFSETLPIRRCNEGFPVQLIQDSLNALGYELEADGYFGDGTRFAVQHYQRSVGIRATGQVDAETWRILFKDASLPGNDLNGDGMVTPNEFSGG
jgi:hypothetical protein